MCLRKLLFLIFLLLLSRYKKSISKGNTENEDERTIEKRDKYEEMEEESKLRDLMRVLKRIILVRSILDLVILILNGPKLQLLIK